AANDPEAIKQEVGDVLLHVAFQIVLGEESGLSLNLPALPQL
ncbi:MAG TPA: hypothetical protein EYO90_06155, partial [Candidatus Latescibacteria bacterium]|nr:hypothetical protein [Candidatus Latescibacterota bacterium]